MARTSIVVRGMSPNLWGTAANRFSPCCLPWQCNAPTIIGPTARGAWSPRTKNSTWQAVPTPSNSALGVGTVSFSPGVRRMMGRVGAKQPFAQGRGDLEELAGVVVQTKVPESSGPTAKP